MKMFGYGEDSFTLWALKRHTSDILEQFRDKTALSDCVIFYRPSFGRHSKESGAVFGEFDAIIASSENIYLIESKWDNLSEFTKGEFILRAEQKLRHHIFSWYVMHWNEKYFDKWEIFVKEQMEDFTTKFPKKKIAPTNSLLATNLQLTLSTLQKHCRKFLSQQNIKDVLLFFYNKNKSTAPTKITKGFNIISIDYSKEIKGNFITLN